MKTKEDGKKQFMMNVNGNKIVKAKRVLDSHHRNKLIILQWSSRQTLVGLVVDALPHQFLDEAVTNATVLRIDRILRLLTKRITPIEGNIVKYS